MAEATEGLTAYLTQTGGLNEPEIPVYANLNAAPYPAGSDGEARTARADILAAQASHPVRWADTLQALADAGDVAPEAVGYINAHGTSTPLNDRCETAAIKTVFGDHAYQLAVSSTKSMTGHMLGAAGAVEAVFTALALHDDYLPATIGYAEADPDCDLDYIPNEGRAKRVEYALSNSLGFGGHNACLLFKKWEG